MSDDVLWAANQTAHAGGEGGVIRARVGPKIISIFMKKKFSGAGIFVLLCAATTVTQQAGQNPRPPAQIDDVVKINT